MADIVKIPTAGVPAPFSAREIWGAGEPTDQQVWGVCPYLRDLERCKGCPGWEDDEAYGKVKPGCRMLAEEACRVVMAGLKQP